MPENYVILWHKKTRKLRNFLAQKNDHFRIVPVHFRTNQLAIQSKTRTNSYELVRTRTFYPSLLGYPSCTTYVYTHSHHPLCVHPRIHSSPPHLLPACWCATYGATHFSLARAFKCCFGVHFFDRYALATPRSRCMHTNCVDPLRNTLCTVSGNTFKTVLQTFYFSSRSELIFKTH